ncbi:glycosyltransferase family 10 domain-containing protein [Brevundimonas sp. VNH65]|uniref:glycosyltransferase family 10 domain-containing protein n=1 Tax=Brevundimonas sp. VNH65 TaxID=3400917 RepID=UPI003C0A75B7
MRNVETESDLNVPFADKTITFAATYKLSKCLVDGVDKSLNKLRCDIAVDLHRSKQMKIIGRDWPDNIAEAESRFDDRPNKKLEFLSTSNFNFCYENSHADYYVSEKLWEAISGGCLPIYYPKDSIYLNFPRNSLIDGREFPSSDDLAEFVNSMTFEEYRRRVNLCRRIFNLAVSEQLFSRSRQRTTDRLNMFLRTVVSQLRSGH